MYYTAVCASYGESRALEGYRCNFGEGSEECDRVRWHRYVKDVAPRYLACVDVPNAVGVIGAAREEREFASSEECLCACEL